MLGKYAVSRKNKNKHLDVTLDDKPNFQSHMWRRKGNKLKTRKFGFLFSHFLQPSINLQ